MSQNKEEPQANQTLRQQLSYLKLQFAQEHFEELARQAAQKQWSHLDFLGRLIEGEAHLRQDRATQRRIQQARFPVIKLWSSSILPGRRKSTAPRFRTSSASSSLKTRPTRSSLGASAWARPTWASPWVTPLAWRDTASFHHGD